MPLTDKQIEEVFWLLKLGTGAQRQRFLGYLEGLCFNEAMESYDVSNDTTWPWRLPMPDDGSSQAGG